ncbi:ABC transporter ATP-binding protein [Geodermatophilaceae bacterium NBWT11]|nr:ABC transporter ATP-binding protein [Geodermatophilaceae bacterium NBWT11]
MRPLSAAGRWQRVIRRRRSLPVATAVATVWRADRRGTLVAGGLALGGALCGLGLVAASHLALRTVLDTGDGSGLVLPLLLIAVLTAASGSIGVLTGLHQRVLGERVAQAVWRSLLASCASVDLVTYESTGFLDRLERVRGNAVSRPAGVVTAVFGLAGGLLGVLVLGGALLTVAPVLVPVLAVGAVPAVLLSRRASRAEFALARRSTASMQRRGYLKSLLSHRVTAAELRAFDAAPGLLARHDAEDAAHLGRLQAHVGGRRRTALAGLVTAAVALGAAMVVVVWLATSGRIGLPGAGAAAVAARLLGGQLARVFRSLGSLVEAGPFLADLDAFLADFPARDTSGVRQTLHTGLAVRSVSFTYPGQTRPALDDVSLDVLPGRVVALVGENGSGKTTLAKVLAGLYAPASGAVCWDGRALGRDDLRASTSVLFQDFLRYQMSVTDNVAVSGGPGRTTDPDRVAAVLDRVGVGDAVRRLPHGQDTVLGVELGEGGDLSGGQWQRVALARALYRDSDLVVLDEPSAALDPRAEHELFRDVRAVLDGRAAVLVSHRWSSVRLADVIHVLHEGRVVEHGSHEELVAAGGRYAELYALQADAFGG